ncbi:MAG TPA: hypothetical protein VK116_15265, partial [Planctomycetota bacterium]|nr:hypothetical protein [Planctomycetota bacterium]
MSKTKFLERWMRAGVVMSSAWMCAAIGAEPLFAGSVFMKNGYIIQGPIVEESKDAIVLGWQNGEV